MMDRTYIIIDDNKVLNGSSYTLYILKITLFSLALNELATRLINCVKSIHDYLIYMLI